MPVEITEVIYPQKREEWRQWLQTHHQTKPEVWVRLYKKDAGKPSLPYDHLVEECLCFGWIDGVVKKYDDDSRVQRISPRRKKKTFLSELNRQRVWKLQHQGLMTPAGISPIADQIGHPDDPLEIPGFILQRLKEDPQVWANFQDFPHFYKRLKIGWISENRADSGNPIVQQRLEYLVKMTAQGKRYGTEPLKGVWY
jgi:uncharacterized protein YdeI (YjbR/CyaY-like superfamily)